MGEETIFHFYRLTGLNRKLLIRVKMPKNNRNGQAAILSDSDYSRIRKHLKNKQHRLIFDIARYTGERWGAILKLQVRDVYDAELKPREEITFRAATRKASPSGERKTRQVPLHPQLRDSLEAYKASTESEWLFPSPLNRDAPLTFRAGDSALRRAVALAGLESKGISTHSTRRTFITRLHSQGVDLYTLQKITGHQDLKALGKYVEISSDRVKGAIAVL